MRRQALHRGRGRVLQLRVVHGAHRPAGHERVHQGLVGLQAARPRARPGRPGRLRLQHVGRLRPRGHQEPEGRCLHRGHEGRLRHRCVGRVPRVGPRQRRALRQRRRRLRRVREPARLVVCDRVHASRLPARRDRAHRHLPHHREGPEHLHQVQPDPARLRLRPRTPRRPRIRLHRLRRQALPRGPPVGRRRADVRAPDQARLRARSLVRRQAHQHLPRRRHPQGAARARRCT